jgi:nucleoside-diphosphate-sugar epimerase
MNERPAARPNPNEKLVRIFDTEQESEALVVHGLLESTRIDSDVTSLDAQQDILPGVGGTIILVREEDAAKAKRVLDWEPKTTFVELIGEMTQAELSALSGKAATT